MDTRVKNYNGIDLFKFFFALCVVAIHVHPFNVEAEGAFSFFSFLNTILNTAVPFFFIANGFFMAGKMKTPLGAHENLSVVCNVLKKYVLLYVIWTAIYLPVTVYYYITAKMSPLAIAYNFMDGLLFTGEHWYSWSLWYLCALIWAITMIAVLIKYKCSDKILLIVSVALFVFAYIYGHFLSSLAYAPIQLFRTVFGPTGRQFTAPLYVMIGILLRRKSFSSITGGVFVLLGFACSPLFPSAGSGYYSEPSLLLLAVGVFILALSFKLPNSKLFLFFRTSSMVLYFTHLLFYVFISLAFFGTMQDGLLMYGIVIAVCLIISIPIFFLEQRKNRIVGLCFSGRWKN